MAKWSVPWEELARRQNQRVETVVRGVTFELFKRIIMRSPVDTGRFRANWTVAHDNIDTNTTDSLDKTGSAAISSMQAAVLQMKMGSITYMTNSLPYATTLEYGKYPNPPEKGSFVKGKGFVIKSAGGFSSQAPNGMVRVTAREIGTALQKVLNK